MTPTETPYRIFPMGVALGLAAALVLVRAACGHAQDANFVAPPRTIADITAILDREKPDMERVARLRAAANEEPSPDLRSERLSQFYYGRAQARSDLGMIHESIADAERAIELADKNSNELFRLQQFLVVQLNQGGLGDVRRLAPLLSQMAIENDRPGRRQNLFSIYRHATASHVSLGQLDLAETFVRRAEALFETSRSWPGFIERGDAWAADVELSRGRYFSARGQHRDAETAYSKSVASRRRFQERAATLSNTSARSNQQLVVDATRSLEGMSKAHQGRMAEAEADVRRVLLSRLKLVGKYHATTARSARQLADVLLRQGRYQEAEKLARSALEIYRVIGARADMQTTIVSMSLVATTLELQERWNEVKAIFDEMDSAIARWESRARDNIVISAARVRTLYQIGNVAESVELAEQLVVRELARVGNDHFDYAMARGLLAMGLTRSGQGQRAQAEFGAAVPLLISSSQDGDDDESTTTAARADQVRNVVESYLALLVAHADEPSIVEGFRLAELIRGGGVQKAFSASSARFVAREPGLADLAREEQDLRKQIAAQLGLLNRILANPSVDREEKAVGELRQQVARLRTEHARLNEVMGRRFPEYESLINPKPPSIGEIRSALKPDEALLSFYFGRDASFVWAVSPNGKVGFQRLSESAAAIERKIKMLRAALDPQASSISEIPPFDLALSHELYKTLLEPVRSVLSGAKQLILITNGALGFLPLGVLTTAPYEPTKDEVAFASYRAAPWLARQLAVTVAPSASALTRLRRLPAGSEKREKLIAFGDPWFNPNHATEQVGPQLAAVDVEARRGIALHRRSGTPGGGDSVDIGQLPRLPDTADELHSIALALEVDPAKALFLGNQANEEAVKKTDLSGFKIVAFATHGLVPGELDGLDQPALALSAPSVAGVDGDGLLTMQEILSLKLDADWVVLSACNTGAGAGVGAEAASGLGRAFFYAGTRAILLTNWSVHSQSARELVADLFGRQAKEAKLSRSEALRQAMMALLDGSGFRDEGGKMLFSYAHPLFWAPYTIIGDGG